MKEFQTNLTKFKGSYLNTETNDIYIECWFSDGGWFESTLNIAKRTLKVRAFYFEEKIKSEAKQNVKKVNEFYKNQLAQDPSFRLLSVLDSIPLNKDVILIDLSQHSFVLYPGLTKKENFLYFLLNKNLMYSEIGHLIGENDVRDVFELSNRLRKKCPSVGLPVPL